MLSTALIPSSPAGLWRGASEAHFSIPSLTLWSMMQLWVKYSPPCTTLWPTASISSRERRTPCSGSTSSPSTSFIPSVWSATGLWILCLSFPGTECVISPSSIPILSTRPLASRECSLSLLISSTWYLIEELPQFKTSIIIFLKLFRYRANLIKIAISLS